MQAMALRTLYQTLLDSDLARVRVIARQWEIPLTAERRPDLAAELADGMARAPAVERALAALPPDERAALDDLLQQGGQLPWATFSRRWGLIRAVGPGRLEREELWRTPISPAEGLWYRGFLQRAFQETSTGPVEVAFVPEELRLYLPAPPPLQVTPPEPVAPPAHIIPGDDSLADDLVTLWAYLQNEPVRLAPLDEHQTWPPRHREILLRRFSEPHETRLDLLEALAREQGWLRQDEEGTLRPVAEPLLAWLKADRWAQWESLARAWLESTRWHDLAAVPTLRADPALGWPDDPLTARRALLALLKTLTPGVWYSLTGFMEMVRTITPDFLRPDGNYDTWALHDAPTDAPLRGFAAWDAVEGALIAFVVTGPLAWLGLVDLGSHAPTTGAEAFRLTEAGAALLGLSAPPTLPTPLPLKFQPDGTLRVPAARRYERFQLSRIAHPIGEGATGRYRLSPRLLLQTRRRAIPLERIASFLAEAAGQPLPAGLARALERAYQEGDEVRLDQVWVLRVRDPAVLERPTLRALTQERLGTHAALIREADRERALAFLAQEGVLVEVNSEK